MPGLNRHELLVNLIDVAGEPGCEEINISINSAAIMISSKRHGIYGPVVLLERRKEQLRCIVWSDVNQDGSTHTITLGNSSVAGQALEEQE